MPDTPQEHESTYFMDAESGAETARLLFQDRLITQSLGGIFPDVSPTFITNRVLDLACGPGGWVLDVAHAYQKVEVVGVDISQKTIKHAKASAWAQGLDNAVFQVMDVTKPLDFPDGSFDLINARTIAGFMRPANWPTLLQECSRITRPGGFIRLTEGEWGFTNAPALERLCSLFNQALQVAGQSFSPTGHNFGITPMLGHFIRHAGYHNIQHKACVIDFSVEASAYHSFREDLMVTFQLIQPFLIKWGVISQEEVSALYDQMCLEMLSDDFCGLWYLLTVWGEKPE